jgi:branched-subunit amino acid aminotransferase/4-amino-4-deoxychorismate lyase
MAVWFNGEILEAASVDAANAGSLLGWGVFTTIGVREGRPILWDRHYARLARDAADAGIDFPWSLEQFEAGIHSIVRANAVRYGLARATLTKCGDGRWNAAEGSDLLLLAQETPPLASELVRLWITPYFAPHLGSLTGVKTTSYLPYILAWQEAQRAGCHDALLTSASGKILETARANVFWIRGDILYTPSLDTGCLRGVGREFLLEIARNAGWKTEEIAGLPDELLNADEALIVSAATGPRAVASYLPDHRGRQANSWTLDGVKELKRLWDASITV